MAIADAALLISAIVDFVLFAWAINWHFSSTRVPLALKALSGLSLANFCWFIAATMHQSELGLPQAAIAITLNLAALLQFLTALKYSRGAGLKLLFDEHEPSSILTAGLYDRVRHPFYGAYIIFWVACAIAANSIIVGAVSAVICAVYVVSARHEEHNFLSSPVARDYENYVRKSGMFFPKLFRLR